MRSIFTKSILSFGILMTPALAQDKSEKPEKSEKSEAKAEAKPVAFSGTKVSMVPPANWTSVPPKNNIIESEFRFPEEGEEYVRVTFSRSGGSIEDNIKRWIGQFEGAKSEDSKVEKKEIQKLKVHTVDVTGTYLDSMGAGGPFAPGPKKKRENYRMVGAIIEMGNGPGLFIKAYGPKDLVEKTKEDFQKMIEGLKNE
jgi:hypothetical protein